MLEINFHLNSGVLACPSKSAVEEMGTFPPYAIYYHDPHTKPLYVCICVCKPGLSGMHLQYNLFRRHADNLLDVETHCLTQSVS